jgi:hypothetical protein
MRSLSTSAFRLQRQENNSLLAWRTSKVLHPSIAGSKVPLEISPLTLLNVGIVGTPERFSIAAKRRTYGYRSTNTYRRFEGRRCRARRIDRQSDDRKCRLASNTRGRFWAYPLRPVQWEASRIKAIISNRKSYTIASSCESYGWFDLLSSDATGESFLEVLQGSYDLEESLWSSSHTSFPRR